MGKLDNDPLESHQGDCVMTIVEIVEQALKKGYLTPTMETEVGRICDNASELSVQEYEALDQLMGALLTGQVVAVPRKQFINVMEELVLTEAITRVSELETRNSDVTLDLGDIAAYALNRLPPLYATTEEGANYQRAARPRNHECPDYPTGRDRHQPQPGSARVLPRAPGD